ncbi:MAG: hypothetical protein J5J06_17370 [Phycisphaerae bacterium]|nr:hypothetical protein [Phycisphaerae bacterium]
MNTRPVLRSIFVLLASVAPLVLSACNVQYAFPGKQRPKGPLETWNDTRTASDDASADIRVVDSTEADLVEDMVAHRQGYHRGLKRLERYYREHGDAQKANWAAYEMEGLQRVKAFRYLMEAEVASDKLRPTESIPEADALYEQGLKEMRRGGHGVPALYREDVMVEAAQTFRKLIEQYPSSDKIDDAAYMLGEIHKEYLPDQDELAAKWFERAWEWDPQTPHPARFEAATVYDYRLHDRERALELYHAAVENESTHLANTRFAEKRIEELSRETSAARVGQ